MVLDAFRKKRRSSINERKSFVHDLRRTFFLQAAAVVSIGAIPAITWAQPEPDANDPIAVVDDAGAAAFHKNCAACHSIGGQGAGEDISFTIRIPESRLEQEIFEMEKYTGPLELDQIMDLISLMKSTEAAERLKTAKEEIITKGGAVAEAAAGPAPAEVHPGGPAFAESCATCHIIGGQGALTGTDISFTVHWAEDEIKTSIKKMEKYTGVLPPEKVQALIELMKREDAAAHIKAAKGGAAVAQAPAPAAPAPATTATATPDAPSTTVATTAETPSTATATAQAVTSTPAQVAATETTPAPTAPTATPSAPTETPSKEVAEATPAATETTEPVATEPGLDANDPIAVVDDAGAAAFHKNCAACHSIGGQGAGEDISFTIRIPESRLEQEIFEMEKYTGPLELDQIMDLIDLMKSTEAADRLKTAKEEIVTKGGAGADAAAGPAPAEVHPGGIAFAESCATCHIIGGQGALTGTDISFTIHWAEDEIKTSIKKMEKYTGPLPPEKVQALTELMQRKDAAAHIKAATGGAAVAQAPSPAAPASTATATAPAQPQSTASQVAEAPAKPAATEWVVTTATKADEQKPTAPQIAAAEDTSGDPMAALFINRCAVCHTIGGGMTQGPDLAFTRNKGFPVVEAAVRRMQMQAGPLEETQIKGLTELIVGADFKERVDEVRAAKAATAPPRQVAAPPKVEKVVPEELGKELFHGDAPFAKGGVSCNSCHSIGSIGGTAASDLRIAYSMLGEEALLAIMQNTDDKAMHPIYKDHKITEAEAKNILAYLKDTSEHPPRSNPTGIPVWAILAAMFAIGLLGYLFRPFPEPDDRGV